MYLEGVLRYLDITFNRTVRMIEGINASLSSSPQVSRLAAEVVSTAPKVDTRASTIQTQPVVGPYISPDVVVDANAAIRAVLQIRDSSSGEVLKQYPTESQLQAFARSQEVLKVALAQGARPAPVQATPVSQPQPEFKIESAPPLPEPAPTAPEANVVQAQASGQTPQTTVSDPVSFSESV